MRTRDNPALVLLVVISLAIALFRFNPLDASEPLRETDVTGCGGLSVHLSGAQAELLRLHNEARKEHGLEAFCASGALMSAATAHSNDMLERGYYAHDTPEGATPFDRMGAEGYEYSLAVENIARAPTSIYGKPTQQDLEEVVEGWMESPGHRANLLNPDLREIGVGVATGNYKAEADTTALYTVDFGTPR